MIDKKTCTMIPDIGIVILAAGLGTRMKSDKAKVLHELCGRSMVTYVVKAANAVVGDNVIVVVGHQAEAVKKAVLSAGTAYFATQKQQLGTGHAVRCAMSELPDNIEQVVILCGDVPLISTATIHRLIADHCENQRTVSVLAVNVDNPSGYGRIVLDERGRLTAIVEEKDADDAIKSINIINSGIYAIERGYLQSALPKLRTNNVQKEIYLTDIVGIAYNERKSIGVMFGSDSREVIGVNNVEDLQVAEKIMKQCHSEKS